MADEIVDGTPRMSKAGIQQLLKKKGVPASEINAFLVSNRPSANITRILSPGQIQQISSGGNAFGYNPANAQGLVQRGVPGTALKAGQYDNSALGGKYGTRIAGTPLIQGQYENSALGRVGGGSIGGTASIKPPSSGAGGSAVSKYNQFVEKLVNALKTRNRVYSAFSEASRQPQPASENSPLGSSEFPVGQMAEPFSAPEITARDFSGEANSLASEAYGPLFAAIAQGKTNAQGQYNTSDTVVKGLYEKLVADTQQSGVQQGQQYDAASAEAAARAQALQDRQAQVYGDSANQQTELLKSLGQEQAAPQVIAGGLQEQAFQQSQAATQGDAQQQYYQAGKQASNDYTTGVANAQNTQGTVARESLVRDLASVLAQFDQQEASGKTQQATTALELANQLSSRDLQVQTANASNQMGAAQMNQSAQQQALAAQQQAAQFGYQQQRDQRADFEADRGYGLQENQFKLDAASAQAQAQGAAGGSTGPGGYVPIGEDGFNTQAAPQQVVAQADAIDPGRGQEYLGLFNSIITEAQGNLDQYNLQSFASKAAQAAQQNGLSGAAAFAAAATFWKQVMNRS